MLNSQGRGILYIMHKSVLVFLGQRVTIKTEVNTHQKGRNEMFGIMCLVSGGVTGSRTSFLKTRTGGGEYDLVTFLTEELANAKCAELRSNVSKYATAHFSYVPVAI